MPNYLFLYLSCLLNYHFLKDKVGFPDSSVGKEYACNAGDPSLIPGSGRSAGEGTGYPLLFWPGEFHGLYSPWGRKVLNTTE